MTDHTATDPSPTTAEVGYLDLSKCRELLDSGELTAVELTETLLRRIGEIDTGGPQLRSVLAVDETALEVAREQDGEMRAGRSRGPLHGVPVLVKDNIDTAGNLATTAGSFALASPACQPVRDAAAVARLRRAGAIVIGKANMSEWANFRSGHSSSGWSAVGGQCLNPHVLDRSPGGSSSGSGAAVAAGLVPMAVGTETDGSILCPAAVCGVVGIKPTVGLVSRAGVVPISASQDSVGPLARSVADAAVALAVLRGAPLPDDLAADEPRAGLSGVRIGVLRKVYFGYSTWADDAVESTLHLIGQAGATIVDPADIDTLEELTGSEDELTVLLHEFKAGIESYLAGRPGDPGDCPRTLAELIAFGEAHSDSELPLFGQDLFTKAEATVGLQVEAYREALARNRRRAREQGIDATMARHELDALVAPTMGPAWCIDHLNGDGYGGASFQVSAVAGYPAISVPIGAAHGLPLGVCIMGRAWSEPLLIRIAHAVEQLVGAGPRPSWLPQVAI